jgi:hypothetical protein
VDLPNDAQPVGNLSVLVTFGKADFLRLSAEIIGASKTDFCYLSVGIPKIDGRG